MSLQDSSFSTSFIEIQKGGLISLIKCVIKDSFFSTFLNTKNELSSALIEDSSFINIDSKDFFEV